MGIEIPVPPEPKTGSGIYCLGMGIAEMPNIELSLSGIKNISPGGGTVPWNGIHTLEPFTSCSWRKIVDDGLFAWTTLAVWFGAGISHCMVWHSSGILYYECHQTGIIVHGLNIAEYPFAEGTHQVVIPYRDFTSNWADFVAGIGVGGTGKVFGEPQGVAPDNTTETLRIARQRDGTCVYMKRT